MSLDPGACVSSSGQSASSAAAYPSVAWPLDASFETVNVQTFAAALLVTLHAYYSCCVWASPLRCHTKTTETEQNKAASLLSRADIASMHCTSRNQPTRYIHVYGHIDRLIYVTDRLIYAYMYT